MERSAPARPRGRFSGLGRACLVLSVLGLVGGSARGQASEDATPLKAWERVELRKQTKGPAAALPLSRDALRQYSGFGPLWSQQLRLRTSLGGPNAARSTRDSLRAVLPPRLARAAEIFVALEVGDMAAAMDTLRNADPPTAGTAEELFWLIDHAVVNLGSNAPDAVEQADALILRIASHPILEPADRFAARYFQFFVRRLRAIADSRSGRLEQAIQELGSLAADALTSDMKDVAMRAWYLAARLEFSSGRVDEAIDHYQRSLALATELRDPWQQATTAGWLAWAFEQQSRFRDAFGLRQLTTQLLPPMGDELAMSYALLGLGWDGIKIGELEVAETALTNALDFARARGWRWLECRAFNNLGVLFQANGRYDESMQALQSGLEIAEASGERTDLLNNLALLHGLMQRPDRAIPIYQELLVIHRETNNSHGQITVLNNLALATEALGLPDQALSIFEQCLQIATANSRSGASALMNLSRHLFDRGRLEEAESRMRQVLEIANRSGDQSLLADALFQNGRILSAQGRFGEAIRPLVLGDSLLERSGYRARRIPTLIRLASVLGEREQFDRALRVAAQAESLAAGSTEALLPAIYSCRSEIYLRMGRLREAREQARRTLASGGGDAGLEPLSQRSVRQIAQGRAMVSLLEAATQEPDADARERQTWEAFFALQNAKARTLLQYVQGGQRAIEPAVPESLAQQEREARHRVDELWEALDGQPRSRASLDSLRLRAAEAQSEHQRVRALLFAADNRFRRAATAPRVDAAAVRTLLRADVLVLDWLVSRACDWGEPCELLLFAVDANGVEAHVVADMWEVERQVGLLSDLLAAGPAADGTTLRLLLAELGESLLGPVAHRLANYEHLIIAPDGILNQIPYAALVVPEAKPVAERSYLAEHASLSIVPSLGVLHELRSATRVLAPDWDIAIWTSSGERPASTDSVGTDEIAPLPYASRERDQLARHFTRSTTLDPELDGEAELSVQLASLGVFGNSKIHHFIAHGFFDDRRPWRSGLYLGGDAKAAPRKLEIADVYALDFRSDLITLSACETAGGRLDESLGFTGFTQALLASGARAVLAPLWSVDDASSPYFMATFYEMLGAGHSKAEALRQTQLRFLADESLRHPYYWASYVIFGDGSQTIDLEARGPRIPSWPYFVLGGLLLLIFFWVQRRERSLRPIP